MLDSVVRFISLVYLFFRWWFSECLIRGQSDSLGCLAEKTAIVTGGNSGIGFAICTLLASRGCKVIIADVADSEVSRKRIIEDTGNKNVFTKQLNLLSLQSVRKFAEEITKDEKKIDILVNNAGIGAPILKVTEDGLNTVMQVNIFAPFLLTHLLIESLKAAKNARVVFTGSFMAFFSNLTLDNISHRLNNLKYKLEISTGFRMYQDSKLCNILVAQEMGEKLRQYNILVNSADPGMVRTALLYSSNKYIPGILGVLVRNFNILAIISHIFGQDQFGGAQTSFHLASSRKLKETGENFQRCRMFAKPNILEDEKFCEEVWKRIEGFVKLKPEERI